MSNKLPSHTIFLSRRNLQALLNKLDRVGQGEKSACTIVKYQQEGKAYRQTLKAVSIVAVEDEAYYGAQGRPAGEMHPSEEAVIGRPSTGVMFSAVEL